MLKKININLRLHSTFWVSDLLIASGGVVEVVGIGASIRVALSSLATCCYGIGAAIGSLTVVVTRQYQGGSRSSKNDDLEELHVD